jgi:hypothetical protein
MIFNLLQNVYIHISCSSEKLKADHRNRWQIRRLYSENLTSNES